MTVYVVDDKCSYTGDCFATKVYAKREDAERELRELFGTFDEDTKLTEISGDKEITADAAVRAGGFYYENDELFGQVRIKELSVI